MSERACFFFSFGVFFGGLLSLVVCVGGGGKGGGEEKNSLPLRFWEHFRKTLRF